MATQAFYGSMFQSADAFLPPWMSGLEERIVSLVLPHPLPWNYLFAGIQLGLGLGLLWSRTVRVALVASLVWSLSVWVFAEGLGGLASPTASILTGAPGPALLYAWAATLLWPRHPAPARPSRGALMVRRFLAPFSWSAFWLGTSLLQLKIANRVPGGPGGEVSGAANGNPQPLAFLSHFFGSVIGGQGPLFAATLAAVEVFVGLGIGSPRTRATALIVGATCALFFGVVGQDLGGMFAGAATDPGTGPILLLVSAAMWTADREPESRSETSQDPCQ